MILNYTLEPNYPDKVVVSMLSDATFQLVGIAQFKIDLFPKAAKQW